MFFVSVGGLLAIASPVYVLMEMFFSSISLQIFLYIVKFCGALRWYFGDTGKEMILETLGFFCSG